MSVEVKLPDEGAAGQIARIVDGIVQRIIRHWLALFNAVIAIFVLVPFLAPVLMHIGAEGPARLIYLVYRPTCHQLPERSFFLFGPQGVYSAEELEVQGALPPGLTLFQREMLRWVGSAQLGYKIAICQRDLAIYGALLLAGLAFGVMRARRGRRKAGAPASPLKLPLKAYFVLALPMLIDGATQLVGLRESSWPLRLLTGALFGLGTIALAYPYVDEAMQDTLKPGGTRSVPPETGQIPPSAI